jgi:hypothetical protein
MNLRLKARLAMAVDLLHTKTVEIVALDGTLRNYILSKFPAVQGREIVANYPLTAVPKVSDYKSNEAVMLKLMAFVAVESKTGDLLRLTTQALIDNHVPDWETLVRIEIEMMKYNTSFFREGVVSTFLSDIATKALASITPTLTTFLRQLSERAKQA